jgi:hypothetical protein
MTNMKPTPVPGVPEHQCYAVANRMRELLGKRENKAATDNFISSRVSKPVKLQPFQVRMVARFYYRTFMIEPFGEKVRIHLR